MYIPKCIVPLVPIVIVAILPNIAFSEDCNSNLVEDAADIQHALIVTNMSTNSAIRVGAESAQTIDNIITSGSGGLKGPRGMIIGPDGNLYLSSFVTDEVLRYDARDGEFIDVFIPAGRGDLNWPHALMFRDNGNLLVSSRNTHNVLEFDGISGAFIGEFVNSASGGLKLPHGLAIGQDGNLLVVSRGSNEVLRYDMTTGAFIDIFVASGNLINPIDLKFGPDANLYVTGRKNHAVLRFDGNTGAFIDIFTNGGSLDSPTGMSFGPDGNLFVSSLLTNEVLRYNGITGEFIEAFIPSGNVLRPGFMLFAEPYASDCNANTIPDSCDIALGTVNDRNGNGIPDICELAGGELLMSFADSTDVPGIGIVENEDVVAYDLLHGTWSLLFDGSDVGLSNFNIDALTMIVGSNGPDFLISLSGTSLIADITGGPDGNTEVAGADVVRFTPSSLGGTTAGEFSFFFDGSDVGLVDVDIDAISSLSRGRLAMSISDVFSLTDVSGDDEDLIFFSPTSLGATTSGTFRLLFDGSDVGLADTDNEDLNAASLTNVRRPLISLQGDYDIGTFSGDGDDILEFAFSTFGNNTAGTYSLIIDTGSLGLTTDTIVNGLEEMDSSLLP